MRIHQDRGGRLEYVGQARDDDHKDQRERTRAQQNVPAIAADQAPVVQARQTDTCSGPGTVADKGVGQRLCAEILTIRLPRALCMTRQAVYKVAPAASRRRTSPNRDH